MAARGTCLAVQWVRLSFHRRRLGLHPRLGNWPRARPEEKAAEKERLLEPSWRSAGGSASAPAEVSVGSGDTAADGCSPIRGSLSVRVQEQAG